MPILNPIFIALIITVYNPRSSLWLSADKPIYSAVPGVDYELYKIMKLSLNNYYFAVRCAQNSINYTENAKLVSKVLSSDFTEIKKIGKAVGEMLHLL